MTTITITKDDTGKLTGLGEKDKIAYARLKKRLQDLEQGECLSLDVWFDRRQKFHALHFVILTRIFDAQEQWADLEQFRMWTTVGAGHCVFVPGPGGKMVAIPKSISWGQMDDADFQVHHKKVVDFLRSQRATRFLWPTLSDQETGEMIHELLEEFERA